jgi:hypothetical protein
VAADFQEYDMPVLCHSPNLACAIFFSVIRCIGWIWNSSVMLRSIYKPLKELYRPSFRHTEKVTIAWQHESQLPVWLFQLLEFKSAIVDFLLLVSVYISSRI